MKPSDVVADRVKELRRQRGWTAQQLAEVCAKIGAPDMTASVIANIEAGRRDADGRRRRLVTVDELLILAYVLCVPPVLLLLPSQGGEKVTVTPQAELPPSRMALWESGEVPGPPMAHMKLWWRGGYEAAAPIRLYRRLQDATLSATRADASEAEQDQALRILAEVINTMDAAGVSPYDLVPAETLERLRELRLLDRSPGSGDG